MATIAEYDALSREGREEAATVNRTSRKARLPNPQMIAIRTLFPKGKRNKPNAAVRLANVSP
jgi:hypothetical protein